MENNIPKKIHYCWFGTKQMDKKSKKFIDSWKKMLPDYEFKLWTEENFDLSTIHSKYIKQAYKEKKWAFVSDYVRLYALCQEGGIYLDTDVEILKDFNKFLNLNSFISFESDNSLCTAVIGAKKDSEWVKDILKYYDNLSDENMQYKPNSEIIFEYFCNKNKIQNNGEINNYEDITIYPIDFFSAHDLNLNKFYVSKNTISVHHGNASWYSFGHKVLRYLKRIYLKVFKR